MAQFQFSFQRGLAVSIVPAFLAGYQSMVRRLVDSVRDTLSHMVGMDGELDDFVILLVWQLRCSDRY